MSTSSRDAPWSLGGLHGRLGGGVRLAPPRRTGDRPSERGAAERDPRRQRVLVIDDEAAIRELLSFELDSRGYDVELAEHGAAAIAAARRVRFDLAITDLRMPVMGGVETLAALKGIDPSIRVLLTTGYVDDETEAQFRDGGAWGYLRKPFELSELFRMVHEALAD